MSKRPLIAVFAALLGSASLHAQHFLVASARSNSLEEFNSNGTWIRTLATTGPYVPTSIAQSPLTGEIFVTTLWGFGPQVGQVSNVILRYHANGTFDKDWDTFTVTCGACSPGTASLLFDPLSGDLWVATHYGEDLGVPIYILKYPAANLSVANPLSSFTFTTALTRGDQMALNVARNLCIASFIDGDVRCFNTSTGLPTTDYKDEIAASGLGIEPGGLAFDGNNRLYLTSIFTGQVAREVNPGGPIVLLATPVSSPYILNGNLVLDGADLYVPSYFNPSPPAFKSAGDPVYKISTTGTVTPFIFEASPPALGNDHIWGGNWMIPYKP
jgi:DNA-binding beta-propeller fold protein YncE